MHNCLPLGFVQVPTEYFVLVLGRHLKYSCCLYNNAGEGLNEAERNMLGALQVGLGYTCMLEIRCSRHVGADRGLQLA
jgi:cyclopropane fatty-acyl-phospholipid synthase-like methyltransferase